MYDFASLEESVSVFRGERPGLIYGRYGHPTGMAVEARLAALEGAEGALLLSSGMAAIALTVLAYCHRGDHLLASAELYGGTSELLTTVFPEAGIEVETVPLPGLSRIGDRVRPETRLILVESPTNPLLRLVDFEAFFASLAGAPAAPDPNRPGRTRPLTVLDGTFGTPLGQRGLEAGFDLVVHSATKFLGGHDDLVAGLVAGPGDLLAPVETRRRVVGANCDPQTAWLLERGLKTLALRWERQCANALDLAGRLEAHAAVKRVHYPGLPSHPQHELARRQMTSYGAVLAFEVAGAGAAGRVFDALELIARAPSLGGVESMALHPTTSSHRTLTAGERRAVGIEDGLLRVSVGIEDVEDLWRDLERALASA